MVSFEERNTVYEAAFRKYGPEAQTQMAIEEMSELIKEICKIFRGKGALEHLAEEVADVLITIEQLQLIYDIGDQVDKHMDRKIRWLQERLGMEEVHDD